MRYLSVCSGIEAASVAWQPLEWEPVAFAEIDPFPCAVLNHRFPHVPNWGDFTTIPRSAGPIDLLVGGTPCQGFSVAGLRRGLDDDRSNLALQFLRLADRLRPVWLVWENVPGVLSSNGGRDFGAFLGGLAELGYGWAYRILDAQFFGVPQRRRRVFVVGHYRDWRRAAAVLLERASLSGDPPPGRAAGADVAASLTGSLGRRNGQPDGGDIRGHLIPSVATTIRSREGRTFPQASACNLIAHTLRGEGFDAGEDGTGRGTPIIPVDLGQASRGEKMTNNRANGSGGPPGTGIGEPGDPAYTVRERGQAVVQPYNIIGLGQQGRNHAYPTETSGCLQHKGLSASGNEAGTLVAMMQPVHGETAFCLPASSRGTGDGHGQGWNSNYLAGGPAIRRLTPRECERLMGFPDQWTAIPWKGKPAEACPDGPRYRALGNSMAVPCMAWIGRRIALVNSLIGGQP